MITKKTWHDFRQTGLLLFINNILHVFGWAIVYEFDGKGDIMNVYPARVKFRGFGEKETSESHEKIATYLKDNIEDLHKEIFE